MFIKNLPEKELLKYNFLYFYICFFSSLASILIFLLNPKSEYFYLLPILSNVALLFQTFKRVPIFIACIFFMKFTVIPYYYYVSGMQISVYTDYFTLELLNKVSLLLGFFYCGLSLSLCLNLKQPYDNRDEVKNRVQFYECTHCFYIALLLSILLAHFGLNGETLITSGYGASDVNKSPIFEYGIIFYAIALLTTNKKSSVQGVLIYFFLFFYVTKSLLYGGRIEVLQILVLHFYVKRNLFYYDSKIKIYSYIILGFLALELTGYVRSNPIMVMNLLTLNISLNDVFLDNNKYILVTNASDVTYASQRIIGMVEDSTITFSYRLESLLSYIFNIPLSFYDNDYVSYQNLASYKKDIYSAGGGGLIVAYAYVWFGLVGPILAGLWIGKIFSYLYESENKYYFLYSLLVIISFPRWFAYGPITLVKFCVVAVLFYYLLCNFASWLRLNKNTTLS